MRACTTAVCPIWAARIRGVNPCLSFIFTSAPASIMARTTSRPPPKDDQARRVLPDISGAFGSVRAEPVRGWKQYRPVWPRAPTAYLQTRLARSHLFVLGTDLRRHLL